MNNSSQNTLLYSVEAQCIVPRFKIAVCPDSWMLFFFGMLASRHERANLRHNSQDASPLRYV
jgi:hypothetical protein